MSELEVRPISDLLGDRNSKVKVERSWSEDIPANVGAKAPVIPELDRESMILNARPSRRLEVREEVRDVKVSGKMHHFFKIDGKTLEYLGSKEVDVTKFQKDISGRSYRVWLKGAFPDRNDYDDILIWWDNFTVKEMVELLG